MVGTSTEAATGPTRSGARLAFLDALRALAATAVIVQHGAERWWPTFDRFSRHWFDLGRYGVVVFFRVSGFIIPRSLEGDGSLRRFWVARVFRLYPAYWTCIALLVLVSTWRADTFAASFQVHETRNLLVNLTMLQQFVGVEHASGIFYTLTIELLFYAMCSVLFAARLLHRSVALAGLAIGALFLTTVAAPLVLDRRLPAAIPFYLATLFVGVAIHRWRSGAATARDVRRLLLGIGITGALTTWVSYDHFGVTEAGKQFAFAGAFLPWLAGYATFLVGLALAGRSVPRAVLGVGLVSYSLYLMHPVVLAVVAPWTPHWWSMVALLAGTLALSITTYAVVERTGVRAGRSLRRRVT
jgi:peptidoglycan/LPS O-acetylase OafA/YrhL